MAIRSPSRRSTRVARSAGSASDRRRRDLQRIGLVQRPRARPDGERLVHLHRAGPGRSAVGARARSGHGRRRQRRAAAGARAAAARRRSPRTRRGRCRSTRDQRERHRLGPVQRGDRRDRRRAHERRHAALHEHRGYHWHVRLRHRCADAHRRRPVGAYQDALRSVQFSTSSQDPGTSRTIEFRADDGPDESAPLARQVVVTPVNDGPAADDETLSGTSRAVGNTSLVVNDPSDGAPDPAGPQKTVTGDILDGDTDVDGPALGRARRDRDDGRRRPGRPRGGRRLHVPAAAGLHGRQHRRVRVHGRGQPPERELTATARSGSRSPSASGT